MIPAIILAAGLSKRFPGNKLLYTWEGKPVIRLTTENALSSKASPIVIVVGHDRDKIIEAVGDLNVETVYNPNYREGMSSSVKTGIEYLVQKYSDEIEAMIIMPGDAAWAPPEAYDLVIDVYREKKASIVVAAYNGRRGHPILFDKSLIPEILSIREETRGLKKVTSKYRLDTIVVETPYPGVILDLDNPNDLNRVKRTLLK